MKVGVQLVARERRAPYLDATQAEHEGTGCIAHVSTFSVRVRVRGRVRVALYMPAPSVFGRGVSASTSERDVHHTRNAIGSHVWQPFKGSKGVKLNDILKGKIQSKKEHTPTPHTHTHTHFNFHSLDKSPRK
jgi:hypothetical protein